MQGIEELLREIKQTGEGSWELKIEDTVYERRFFRPERLISTWRWSCGTGNQQICVSSWILCYCGR